MLKKLFSLTGLVCVLILLGAAGIVYKNTVLKVPLLPNNEASFWLVEAKIAYEAKGVPVKVALALPKEGWEGSTDGQQISLGYGFSEESESGHPYGMWSARDPKGKQLLYYRVRVEEGAGVYEFYPQSSDEVPQVNSVKAKGSRKVALTAMSDHAKQRSADDVTYVKQVQQLISEKPNDESFIYLQRYYENKYPEKWELRFALDLLKQGGLAARACLGLKLEEKRTAQKPVKLLEYYDRAENAWRVVLPDGGSMEDIVLWTRDSSMLQVYGGENSEVTFTAVKELAPTGAAERMVNSPWWVATISALPVSERASFRYAALIPLGVLAVVLLRNIVGLATLGTFMPVLLGLTLLELPMGAAFIMLLSMLTGGLIFRALLSKYNLLVVPRVAACVVFVTILMMAVSLLSYRLGAVEGLQVTVFPMIVLAWTIERMSLIWDEEGAISAIYQVGGSLVAAVAAYGMMKIEAARYWVEYFPEILLILLAMVLLLGRYTGYRLSELIRFRKAGEMNV